MRTFPKPRLVMSACLDLQPVRYNGEVVKDPFAIKLREYCQIISVCPEVSIGLGVPRDKVILQKGARLIQPTTGRDLTQLMLSFSREFLDGLDTVDGFLLKSKSPSCGVSNARIYKDAYGEEFYGRGKGLFATQVLERYKLLPVEDEGRLKNKELREHFLVRLFAIAELREFLSKAQDVKDLVEFHSRYKYLIMAHSQEKLKQMGKLVAEAKKNFKEAISRYRILFMDALKRRPTKGQHANTLLHIMGHLSSKLKKSEKEHFYSLVESYKTGQKDLCTLLEILKSWSYRFDEKYLTDQVYLEPYPSALNVIQQ